MDQIGTAFLWLRDLRAGFLDGGLQRFPVRVDDFLQFSGDVPCLLLIFR